MSLDKLSTTLTRWLQSWVGQWHTGGNPTKRNYWKGPSKTLPLVQYIAFDSDSVMNKLSQPATVFTVYCVSLFIVTITCAWRVSRHQSLRENKVDLGSKGKHPSRLGDTATETSSQEEHLSRVAILLTAVVKVNKMRLAIPQSPTMASLGSELEHSIAVLCQIQQLLSLSYSVLNSQQGMRTCFETILSGLATVISTLDGELSTLALPTSDPKGGISVQRATTIKEIENMTMQLKEQREAMLFVVNSIQQQTESQNSFQPVHIRDVDTNEKSFGAGLGLKEYMEKSLDLEELPPQYSPPSKSTITADIKHPSPATGEIDSSPISPTQSKPGISSSKLLTSITQDDIKALKSLLESNADPNATHGRLLRTPLHECARLNRPAHARLLLSYGAIADADDAAGDTPLHLASWEGAVDVASVLLSSGAGDQTDMVDRLSGRDGNAPLFCAVAARHIDVARVLVRHGARVEMRTGADDSSPLHQAAVTGQAAMCELLIERGADIDSRDREENTPLHYASTVGHVRAVRTLVDEGADVNAQQDIGLTALHWACHKGHEKVVVMLLEAGANADMAANAGVKPIHCAAAGGYLGCVQALLNAGAGTTGSAEWDGESGTPREMAQARGYKQVAKILSKEVNR
jgi:ankyrin repeat protein